MPRPSSHSSHPAEPKVPDWEDLRTLLAVAREGSFQAAAQSMKVATSTVARRIALLESALGRVVVQRTSRGTRIESDAQQLVDAARQLQERLRQLSREATFVQGVVRVSMGEGFVPAATQILGELQTTHPELRIELIAESRIANVTRREADIAIRKVRSKQPELIEKKVGVLRFGLYASKHYPVSRKRGQPLTEEDIPDHRFVGYDLSGAGYPQSKWLTARRAENIVFRSNSDAALLQATEMGLGMALLAFAHGHEPPPTLEKVPFEGKLPEVPVYLAWRRELSRVPRVRIVARSLEAALRSALR